MRLLTILLAGSLAILQVAAEPAGQHVRRQSQYASFSNSSRPISTLDSTSTSTVLSSSSEPMVFSYSPETSASLTASPAPTISSISSTLSLPDSVSSLGVVSSSISSSPPSPSSGSESSAGSSAFPITASPSRNSTKHQCIGQTVNVRNASFDWWTGTIDHPVSTLSFQHDSAGQETGWTILPDTAPFTVANSFQSYQCDDAHPLTGTDSDANYTWTYFDCSMVPLTVAAATTVTTLTAFKKPSATTGTDFDVPDIRATHPPDPSITFNTPNATFTPVTDFVYFTQYEVEDSNTITYDNGSAACVTATSSYILAEPYAFTYTGEDPQSAVNTTAAVTGDIEPEFLSVIGRANATAGSYTAVPTVIVIVREIFRATFALYAAPMAPMKTATSLATPTAELPPGVSASSTSDNWAADLYSTLTASARIESTAQILLVPPPISSTSATALQQQADSGDANSVLSNALGSAIMQGIGASGPTQQVAIGTNTALRTSVTAVVVGGQTALAGGGPITVGGHTVSVAGSDSSVIVNGQTSQLSGGSPSTFAVDGIQLTATRAVAFAVAGQTVAAGGSPIIVDGTKLSLASGGNAMMIGSSTLALSPPGVITVAAQTITADPATRFALAPGQTLTPGGSASVSGTTVTLVQAGTAIVIDGKTTRVGTVTANYARITSGPVLLIDGQSYTPDKGGAYVIAGQSLLAGGAITFTGRQGVETVSLDRSGTVVVDVVSGKSTTTTLASSPPITLAGRVYTAYSGGATYVIDDQTLTPGAIKTVTVAGGTYIVSLASTPTAVVIQTLSNGRAVATSTEMLTASANASSSPANKSPTAESNVVATSSPATGEASSMMMEMLTALFGAAALGLAAIL